jgi:hypothetical protein
MTSTAIAPAATPTPALDVSAAAPARSASLPAFCWVMVLGATCIPLGVLWDISWHSTIGRDTFWTPAHIMTYLGGLLPGLTAGWLALKTHFRGTPEERAAAVNFWGFRAPLGAWVVLWGAFTMLLSAPFDNWWHDAYGLDVKILSPPHTLLATGMLAVATGVLLLMLSWQNRAAAEARAAQFAFIFVAGVMVLMAAIYLTERSFPNQHRTASFYLGACATYPLYLVGAARASRLPWPATTAAAIYMLLSVSMTWILPLFPGEPKLAPIYNPVTHMVPPAFPLLMIAPALVIDLLMRGPGRKAGFWRDHALALALGAVFFGVFLAVQWHFARFLISPAADNWFFAGNRSWTYYSHLGDWTHEFWGLKPSVRSFQPYSPMTLAAALRCLLFATLAARAGLALGRWMRNVRR